MSSHHVIRDEQEPPILVFDLHNNWEELSELLGWSPLLLINPVLKELFELKQTKVDGYLLKNGAQGESNHSNLAYEECNLIKSLLEWIDAKDFTAVNIFLSDTAMLDLYDALKASNLPIPLIFFTEKGKFVLKNSKHFRKWYPKGFKIEIIGNNLSNFKNLIEVDNGFIVENDGIITIETTDDLILMKEG